VARLPDKLLTVVVVPNDGLGYAEAQLRHKLMELYLKLLLEQSQLPAALCFYTEGVKLVVAGSPVLELLKTIEAQGVLLISCQTCLQFYGLMDKVQAGIVGGMHDIIELQQRAQKVITV
jgi:sulfur relay (sulfurtransferase) complex TusBCD TusD component (DsrE family)